MRSGGGSSASGSGSSSYMGSAATAITSSTRIRLAGFGFDPFGFGGTYGGASSSYDRRESPEMQAANNYIRNGYYAEAMNVLEALPPLTGRPLALLCRAGKVPAWVTTSAPRTKPHRCGHGARQLRVPEPFGPAAEPRTGVLHLSAGIHPARQPPARHELLFAGLAVPDNSLCGICCCGGRS